jgi:hypothetical protein
MAEAMYARAWYANIPRLTGTQEGQLPFKPIPFLTSAKIFGNKPLRQNLKEFVEKRQVWVDEQLAHLHKASEKLRSYGDSNRLEAHHRYLVNSLAEEQMESEVIGIQNRLAEFESQEGAIGGWSCSGAWYLGVVSSGGNTNVGWSIVEEALDPRRVEERATLGAGLPASASFYRDHSSKEVHGLRGITFGDMQNRFFRRTRSRETVLGIGMPSEPSFLVDESLLSLCREMPEMLNDLVRRILGSERSRPSEKQPNRYKDFIRREVQQLFEAVGREEAESLVDPSAAKH